MQHAETHQPTLTPTNEATLANPHAHQPSRRPTLTPTNPHADQPARARHPLGVVGWVGHVTKKAENRARHLQYNTNTQ